MAADLGHLAQVCGTAGGANGKGSVD
jgi:hypothetical protein